ncbi:MAG: hypothetical protein FJ315_04240, partial [SAR202 cluster bacterium]|nr:hypothetical protein [SAR202 cluster bacterium]
MPRERCAPTSVLILLWILAFCLAPAHALAPPLPLVAEKSRLLYPSDAEVWADAVGTVPTSVSGVTPGPTVEVRALVFRPRGADLTWANHTALYVHRGALPPGPKPMLSVVKLATGEEKTADPDANTEETNVYSLRPGGRFLVLGFFRNQRTQHQLAYAVLLEGKVDAAQALAQGKTLATTLARQVKLARLGPPHPP